MIELDEKSYIVGMWFSSNPVTHNDWMSCIVRDPKDPTRFKGWSRFRTTKDAKIWNSEDEKKWTQFASQEGHTEQYMIDTMNATQEHLKAAYKDTDKIIVKGGLKKLMKSSEGHDWLNMKQVKA